MPARIAGRPLRERERPQDAKKWNERKDALEALHGVLNKPKLMKGDYGNVVRLLKKVRRARVCLRAVQLPMCGSPSAQPPPGSFGAGRSRDQCFGDSNILVIIHAAMCVEDLAKGLRDEFQPYYSAVWARPPRRFARAGPQS